MRQREIYHRIWHICRREVGLFAHRPLFLFCLMVAPVACLVFFTTLMDDGLPTKLPAGIVDEDDTNVTHIVRRILGSMEETDLVARYPNFTEARKAMLRGEIYAFFYIPKGTTEDALANRQPKVSFYTNEAYLVPGTLLMKDMRMAGEMLGLALTRETLYAKGSNERTAMGIIRPIVVETHPLNNSYLNYSVYLTNILLPGILILLIMLSTSYTIGLEWKMNTQQRLYSLAGNSPSVALVGKLLPQTLLFSLVIIFYDVCLYGILRFPCLCGIPHMMLVGVLTVLASQAFGVFFFGLFVGQVRLAMCLCSLWGILSFSLAGFTYPVPAMGGVFRALAWLFPLRHYYLIYVNQALDGYSLAFVWSSVLSMLLMLLLPFFVLPNYKRYFSANVNPYKP